MRIFHLEDDPDILEITEMSLSLSPDVQLSQCSKSADAVAQAKAFHPDLFLLDVMLPEISGPDVLKLLRAEPALANVPAIFMTARVQLSEVDALLATGACGVIAKPFDPLTLADQIKTILTKQA